MLTASFAAVSVALTVGHHIGDQWVQTHHQAITKGRRDRTGQAACARHVLTYTACTTAAVLAVAGLLDDLHLNWWAIALGQLVSAVSHYAIDRRWTLKAVAARIGKLGYHDLGAPRPVRVIDAAGNLQPIDPIPAATGATQLDQSAHFLFLFVAAFFTIL